MADILSYSLRSTFAKEFYQSLTDPASDDRYYMAYGRIKPWDGDTPTTVDTIKEQNEFKRNTAFYQRILPSDVCLMVPRYDWTTGVVYDQYEDDVQLWADAKQYYVFGTPTMFLLDSKREILLRPNSVQQMDAWVDWYLGKD